MFTLEVTVATVIILVPSVLCAGALPALLARPTGLLVSVALHHSAIHTDDHLGIFLHRVLPEPGSARYPVATLGIEQFLHLTYSEPINDPQGVGIILGSVWNSIPITVLLLGAGLSDIDDALIEAARDVGANALTIFLRIIVPLDVAATVDRPGAELYRHPGQLYNSLSAGTNCSPNARPLDRHDLCQVSEPLQADALAVVTFLLAALVGLAYVLAVARRASGTAAGRGV